MALNVQNPADAQKLKQQLILTVEDVSRLSSADWMTLGLTPQTQQQLQSMVSSGSASNAVSTGLILDQITNPKDRKTLEMQLILTAEDVARLTPTQTQSLNLSPETLGLLKRIGGGSAPKPYKMNQPNVDGFSSDEDEESDSDSDEDSDESDNEGIPLAQLQISSGAKMINKAQGSSGQDAELKQVNAAIRAAHRLALRSELEAIRRTDDLARLQKKRAELVRLYKKYKNAAAGA